MYQTLKISFHNKIQLITLHRPEARNSINEKLLMELQAALTESEKDPWCRIVALQGNREYFCTGMDFSEMTQNRANDENKIFSDLYMGILKRFTSSPKVIISLVEGQVLAGGIGLVAASDLVLSSSEAQFGLSEALWGLLPACVTPFLIRRVGFQKAYRMTLTTQTICAKEAHEVGLVDELSDNLMESLRILQLRLCRLEEETIQDLKKYFYKMWIINETMEKTAVTEINRLVNKPLVQQNIKNFVESQKFPWENQNHG